MEILYIAIPLGSIYLFILLFNFIRTRGEKKKIIFILKQASKYWKFKEKEKDGSKLVGKISNLKVVIESKFDGVNFIRIKIPLKLKIKGSFSVAMESKFTRIKENVGLNDIKIGDNAFDQLLRLQATHNYFIPALFSYKTRKEIMGLSKRFYKIQISDEGMVVTKLLTDYKRPIRIRVDVKAVVKICKEISNDTEIQKRLVDNIFKEPMTSVRITNLQALGAGFFLDHDLKERLKKLLKDRDVAIQIEAAPYCDEIGMPHLINLLLKRKNLYDELQIRIIEIFKEKKYLQSIGQLKALFSRTNITKVKLEIINAFVEFGDDGVNLFLLEHFEENSLEIHVAIIKALGSLGSPNIINKLKEIGVKYDAREIQKAVDEAVLRIQNRYGKEKKGMLSVSEMDLKDGALSVSDDADEGALSLDDEEKKDKH